MLSRYRWEAAGAAVLFALLITTVVLQLRANPAAAERARRLALVAQLRLSLASASEAEKSAVLAVTDRQSQELADEARAATAQAEEARAELVKLSGAREGDLLERFSAAFARLRQIDHELLGLAVRNTNLKASALLFGPLAEATASLDAQLTRLIAHPRAPGDVQPAAAALAGVYRIAVLLPVHIAEESDQKMDALEARMRAQEELVQESLDALADGEAAAAWARFGALQKQILQLSRENTNVRSLSLSLNDKRKAAAECQATLAALENAIGEEGRMRVQRPR